MRLLAGGLREQEVLDLWFPARQPTDFSAAQLAISDFYRCGVCENAAQGHTADVPAYSFRSDADAIIAAFQREYGIDLTSARLHWWRFSALLRGLLTHSFSERVQYRVCNPNEIKGKELRARYRKLHEQYALDAHGEKRCQPQTLEEYNELLRKQARGEL